MRPDTAAIRVKNRACQEVIYINEHRREKEEIHHLPSPSWPQSSYHQRKNEVQTIVNHRTSKHHKEGLKRLPRHTIVVSLGSNHYVVVSQSRHLCLFGRLLLVDKQSNLLLGQMNICDQSITLALDFTEQRRTRLTADIEACQVAFVGLQLATQAV